MELSQMNVLTESFRKSLNSHGYGFQYSMLREVTKLSESGQSHWLPWVPEFPVEVRGAGTRIDILLRHRTHPYYLVGECKRANPALANWCFARTPRIGSSPANIYMEVVYRYAEDALEAGLKYLAPSDRIFQVALEIRTGDKGDPQGGRGRGDIEDAATQVCRGMNGLIQYHYDRREQLMTDPDYVCLVPVIFTTARLFSTEADVSEAELASGELQSIDPTLEERDWLWYDYPQSPGLKHTVPSELKSSDLREVLYQDYMRRIGVVNPAGLTKFLAMSLWG